ncbi:MAG: DUF998 domain-containing protein [Coriobacteriia bacterium]|nr:DUF998 domain-containing protein [Coriobacteriia bacterium]
MRKKQLTHWLCLSGVIGLLFYLLHDTIGAMHYPDYNWMSQAVSDLTAVNAPSFAIASGLSSLYHLFSCLCCVLVCIVVQGKANRILRLGVYLFTAMSFVSAIGYSLFPLSESGFAGSFQDIMHLYVVTTLVVVLSIASLVLITVGGLRKQTNKSLAIISLLALLVMFIGTIGAGAMPLDYFGIAERFSVYSAVIFTAILGIYGFMGFEGSK